MHSSFELLATFLTFEIWSPRSLRELGFGKYS
jgi:hypothetical protein